MLQRKLAIVPVGENNSGIENPESKLNAIYLRYGIEWSVRMEPAFTDMSWSGEDGKLDAGKSGFFTAYTSEMKSLNRSFRSQRSVHEDEAYLFVFDTEAVNEDEDSGVLLGDMPIGYQFGYLFSNSLSSVTAKTIAHELGHGIFQLNHTFESSYGIAKSSTNNLMDYTEGVELVKQQWDAIYDPQILVTKFLQDDEEGEYTMDEILEDFDFIEFLDSIEIDIKVIPFDVLVQVYEIWISFKNDIREACVQTIRLVFENNLISLETVHTALDVAGFVPVIGELADGTNMIIYVAKGDYINATFSGISLVPMAGDATGKGLKYTIKIIENSSSAGKNAVGILRKIPVDQLTKFIKKIYSLPTDLLQRLFKDFIENPVLLEKVALNQKLVDAWKKMDNLGADDVLRKNPGALDALAKKDAGEVVPDPSTYLDVDYISNHLAKFDDGAVRFTSRNAFDNYGTLGPDGGFTLPKSELDRLLNETGGNLREVEKKLDLDNDYLDGEDAMIVLIEKQNLDGLRMPSGNEGGANEFWIPGGKTSGGVYEAVMDFSGKPPFSEINLN